MTPTPNSVIRSFSHSVNGPSHSVIQSFNHSVIRKAPGFTLVELIVVIGIIGILAGVLLSTFGGSTESARSAQCMSNMRNIAAACQTYGVESKDNIYPLAIPAETKSVSISNGRPERRYYEHQGWISWYSKGNYPSGGAKSSQSNPTIGFRTSDDEKSKYALTNSCIWTLVGRNGSTFVCPSHAKAFKEPPIFSYLMNEHFAKWIQMGRQLSIKIGEDKYNNCGADRVLLLSEIPFKPWHSWLPDGTGTSADDDAALQYPNGPSKKSETIGANHVSGRDLFAHVAFADGHTEKLRIPYTGNIKNPTIDESQLKDLTEWLCTGFDVSFSKGKYQKLDN